MLKGIDISEWQGSPDFDTLKTAVDFVLIRASYGTGYIDKSFARSRDEARRVGLLRGFYHYAYPEYNTPEAEADWFANTVGTPQLGEILALDYESSWGGDMHDWCKRFLDQLSTRTGGYKPLVYLNLYLTKQGDWKPVIDADYGLWLAQWDYNADAAMNPNTPWPFLAMRQYSNKENIGGVNPVDANVFYGDVATFEKYGYHPAPTPPPAPTASDFDIVKTNKVNEYRIEGIEGDDRVYQIFTIPDYAFFQKLGNQDANVRVMPSDWPVHPEQWVAEREAARQEAADATAKVDDLTSRLSKAATDLLDAKQALESCQSTQPALVSDLTFGELLSAIWNKIKNKK